MGRDAETVRGYEGGNRGRRVGRSSTATVSSTPRARAHALVFLYSTVAIYIVHV